MRTRYVLDEQGYLRDRNGKFFGRVVLLTVDDTPPPTTGRVGDGVGSSSSSAAGPSASKDTNVEPHTPRPTATQLEREVVNRIWDYWLEISAKRQKLDSKRERIIRNALALVGEDGVKKALLGLTRSPWHSGANPDSRQFMEIRYALKGRGDESDDERIEKAISWAANYAPGHKHLDEDKVQRYLSDVRYTLSLPHRPSKDRAKDSYRRLRAAGFSVVSLDGPPWARLER